MKQEENKFKQPLMIMLSPSMIIKIAVVIVLIAHSIPGMVDGGVNGFGKFYLNEIGFAPIGVPLAWAIKISHVVCAILILTNRFMILACLCSILIMVLGIVMVHFKEGWFVVGGGRNGMEYNFVLIAIFAQLMINAIKERQNN